MALDITRDQKGGAPFRAAVDRLVDKSFVPLAVGGGVHGVSDALDWLRSGADKVVVNGLLHTDPNEVTRIARKIGSQSVVASIDAKRTEIGYEVYANGGQRGTSRTACEVAAESVRLGCGEILVASVDRDGSLSGYDLDLCGMVADSVDVPVVFCSGVGNWGHLDDGLRHGASAVGTSNIYHFTRSSIRAAKTYLRGKGHEVRGI